MGVPPWIVQGRWKGRTAHRRFSVLERFLKSGCAGVAARCVALPRPAHRALKIIRISAVFCGWDRLLICGLWVRFPPGSPAFARLPANRELRLASHEGCPPEPWRRRTSLRSGWLIPVGLSHAAPAFGLANVDDSHPAPHCSIRIWSVFPNGDLPRRLRGGCRWSRVIQPVNAFPRRRLGQPVRVNAERNCRILVSELTTHVRCRSPRLQQQRRKRVSHLVRFASMQLRLVEQLIQRLADVRGIKWRAGH